MYRYRRGTQISLSRCFLASALARSRKLFPELFGIVMEFQYSNSVPHRRRRCWTIFEDIIYIFLFFLSRGQYSRFFSYFCQVLPSFSQINFRQPSSSLPLGLTAKISRTTFPAGLASFTSHKPAKFRGLELNFSCTCQLSSSSCSSVLQRRRVLFFFISTEHLGARRRVRLVRRVAGSQWTTSGGKKKERERGKGKRIGDSLARVLESRVSRSGEKMEIFTSLCSFLFLSRKLDSLLLLLSSS